MRKKCFNVDTFLFAKMNTLYNVLKSYKIGKKLALSSGLFMGLIINTLVNISNQNLYAKEITVLGDNIKAVRVQFECNDQQPHFYFDHGVW